MKNHDERLKSIYQKADTYHKKQAKTRKLLYSAGTTVVCAALVILSVTVIPKLTSRPSGTDTQVSQTVPPTPDSTAKGVTIPAMKLETPGKGVKASMIGLVVYNGKIYTQAQIINGNQALLDQWLGDKLGTATGSLNEWSTKMEYDTEFASTIPGDVYTVKGFDKDFRICVPMPNGDGTYALAFMENLNGITVYTGADLYGKLELKDNYTAVTYQLHEDWDNGRNNVKPLTDLSDDQVNAFVDALYSSPFEDLSQQEDLYSSGLEQAHLYFTMKDGTTLGLRLFENGYVAYEHMYDRVFVHMTDDIFKTVFEASTK